RCEENPRRFGEGDRGVFRAGSPRCTLAVDRAAPAAGHEASCTGDFLMFRFMNAAAALLLLLTAAGQASAASEPRVVVISLDGFPAWYLDDPEVSLPVIRGLRDAGASTAEGMHVSNPSVTWPNHTTMM